MLRSEMTGLIRFCIPVIGTSAQASDNDLSRVDVAQFHQALVNLELMGLELMISDRPTGASKVNVWSTIVCIRFESLIAQASKR